jgi:hypothetical protein
MLEIDNSDVGMVFHLLCEEGCTLPHLEILAIFDYFEEFEIEDSSYNHHMPDLISLCPNLKELRCTDLSDACMHRLLDALPDSLDILSGELWTLYNISELLSAINSVVASGKIPKYRLCLSIYDYPVEEHILYYLEDGHPLHWLPGLPYNREMMQEEQLRLLQQHIGEVLRRTFDYHNIRYDHSDWPADFVSESDDVRQRKM